MKIIYSGLIALSLLLTTAGCSYNTVQQQNGTRAGSQLAVVGRGEGQGVVAYQSTGSAPGPYLPPSTYPQDNGYPGSGRRYYYRGSGNGYNPPYAPGYNPGYGGPVGPAYPPDDAGIPYPLPIPGDFVHAEVNLY